MSGRHLEAITRAMRTADFYPHATQGIEVRDTHISRVFLTGKRVYKIKKPVNLGFLDFSTLEKRRANCRREVDLNRRLSSGVYCGVIPISHRRGGYQFGEGGKIVEYAVKMNQLDESRSLASLVARKTPLIHEIRRLAEKLTGFYLGQADRYPALSNSYWQRLYDACEENFAQTQSHAGTVFDEASFLAVREATRSFLTLWKGLFDDRIRTGKIVDGHGDLRTDHIYFTEDSRIQLIDCIEFNDRLRYIDAASDIGFLAMDLEFRGAEDLAVALTESYVKLTGDCQAYAVLPFYKCYRAMVRCKVGCIRLTSGSDSIEEKDKGCREVEHHLELALRYALEVERPSVWVVCGMPASGKSTLAKALSKTLGVACLRSDVIRKEMFGLDPWRAAVTTDSNGIYSEDADHRTYKELIDRAGLLVAEGRSVVLDATFSRRRHRRQLLQVGTGHDVRIWFVECLAPDGVLMDRLKRREHRSGVSDARPQHFSGFKERYQPFTDVNPRMLIRVSGTAPMPDTIGDILSGSVGSAKTPTEQSRIPESPQRVH
ncbi:MAG: AAA family ATPase [Desulfobacterales bacterium]|jgi:hypothetical protein